MELNDRKIQILEAIIMNYLETAEPVGSRTISKRFPLGISSATIRNEMSDLEDLGLIVQPYTSAGRIPSSKGYRMYVDHLQTSQPTDLDRLIELKRMLRDKTNQLDTLMREVGDLLAALTNYTAIVTLPQFKKTRLKHLQLIPLDEHSLILVVITDGNVVRNNVLRIQRELSTMEMYNMSDTLNHHLAGLTVEEITLPVIQRIRAELGIDPTMMDDLLEAIHNTLLLAEDEQVFTAGATNILNFPEFSDIARARALMEVFTQKDKMLSLVDRELPEDHATRVTIGSENRIEQMRDCSVVTATYRYGDQNIGSISVVGPMRMDYDRVISTLNYLVGDFQQMFDENSEKDKKKGGSDFAE